MIIVSKGSPFHLLFCILCVLIRVIQPFFYTREEVVKSYLVLIAMAAFE